MSYGSYEEVSALPINEQQKLLLRGEAVERIWAGWSLGLTLGPDSRDLIAGSAKESPASGTRRHLLVILAGLKDLQTLRLLAGNDPDEYVRATACRYLIRLISPKAARADRAVQVCLLYDPSQLVRETSIEEAV